MVKLLELGSQAWDLRWDSLKDFFKKNNKELIVEKRLVTKETLEENYEKAILGDFDLCVLGEDLSDEILKYLHFTTQEVTHLGATDVLIKKDGKLWPRLLFEEALVRSINTSFHEMDLVAPALVAGCGAYARFAVAALSKVGFKEIALVGEDFEKCKKIIKELKSKFFNIKFNAYEMGELNTLPGEFSLLINTTGLSLDNHLLDELYFFNFLKAHGCVVDLTLVPTVTPLLSEAQTWGARLLSGDRVFALSDILMIENLLQLKVPEDEYCHALSTLASSANVDLEPYLKRFMDRI